MARVHKRRMKYKQQIHDSTLIAENQEASTNTRISYPRSFRRKQELHAFVVHRFVIIIKFGTKMQFSMVSWRVQSVSFAEVDFRSIKLQVYSLRFKTYTMYKKVYLFLTHHLHFAWHLFQSLNRKTLKLQIRRDVKLCKFLMIKQRKNKKQRLKTTSGFTAQTVGNLV